MYIGETMNYTVIKRTYNKAFQALWIELQFAKQTNITCDVNYKQHNFAEGFFTILFLGATSISYCLIF